MSEHPGTERVAWAYAVAILGTFLIIAALAWAIHRYTQPPPLGADRAAERAKALAELRAQDAEELSTAAFIDPVKGIVRLPIQNAMNMILRDWQNPAAGRSNLIDRVEKATAAPPKAPAKPSPFE